MTITHVRVLLAAIVLSVILAGCGSDTAREVASGDDATTESDTPPETTTPPGASDDEEDATDEQRFPDVIDAELEQDGDAYRLSATLSSPYDTPDRYADAFRAVAEDGTVLGVRELAHDHANEQPFTRSLTGLEIPDGVTRITVEGRDQAYGWGGDTVEVEVEAPAP